MEKTIVRAQFDVTNHLLNGKVVIVTGAGRGIGHATALRLATLGSSVVTVDIDDKAAHEVADVITKRGGTALAAMADVTQTTQVVQMVDQVIERLGHIDILVNNAGGHLDEPSAKGLVNEDDELIIRILNLNLLGVIICSRTVLPHMTQNRAGTIINISSSVALSGDPTMAVYSAAKGGVISFTRSLARTLASDNIRVNCVIPGTIDTGKRSSQYLVERIQKLLLGRAGKSEDVAELIAFLASDAANFITGQVIPVNGGQTMQ
ncbi:SDR family NAD(P)-dependent oxidoreductase [Chloroflexota bacterium]